MANITKRITQTAARKVAKKDPSSHAEKFYKYWAGLELERLKKQEKKHKAFLKKYGDLSKKKLLKLLEDQINLVQSLQVQVGCLNAVVVDRKDIRTDDIGRDTHHPW